MQNIKQTIILLFNNFFQRSVFIALLIKLKKHLPCFCLKVNKTVSIKCKKVGHYLYKINTIHVPRNTKFTFWSTSKNITTVSFVIKLPKENCYNRIIICVNKPITYFIKRNMMLGRLLNKLNKRDRIVINRPTIISTKYISNNQYRDYATYDTFGRRAQPLKVNPHPTLSIDEKTKMEIMNAVDYSGKNHILLIDKDYPSDEFYLVLGSFTSSTYQFAGKYPIYISDINLHGESKKQYFHYYATPRLIRKNDVSHDDLACLFLPEKKTLDLILEKARKALS